MRASGLRCARTFAISLRGLYDYDALSFVVRRANARAQAIISRLSQFLPDTYGARAFDADETPLQRSFAFRRADGGFYTGAIAECGCSAYTYAQTCVLWRQSSGWPRLGMIDLIDPFLSS